MQEDKKQQKIFIIGFVIIFFIIAWFLLKPFVFKSKEEESKKKEQKISEEIVKAPSITAQDLFGKIKGKAKIFIIDANDSGSFNRGHIETSINIKADDISASALNSLGMQKTSDIVLVGGGDDLARIAPLTNEIVSSGFVNCKYLQGGISDWRNSGYTLISTETSGQNKQKVKKISIADIEKDAEIAPESIQFLDVRSEEEFSREHIVRAINVPLSEIEKRKSDIPAAKKIIIYGGTEDEGSRAAAILFDFNFFSAYLMEGNISDWKTADGKTE